MIFKFVRVPIACALIVLPGCSLEATHPAAFRDVPANAAYHSAAAMPAFRVYTAGKNGLPSSAVPRDIALGLGGIVWFTDITTPAIGEIKNGRIVEFTTGLDRGAQPYAIVAGRDGNMWFSDESGAIGRITTSGAIAEFSTPRLKTDPPAALTAGPRAMWTIAPGTPSYLVRVALDGSSTAVRLPNALIPDGSLQADAAGNVWFFASLTNHDVVLAERTSRGDLIEHKTSLVTKAEPCCANLAPNHIAIGPDGNPWFTTPYAGIPAVDSKLVGTFDWKHGATYYDADLTRITYPVYPSGIVTTGPDLWFSGSNPLGFDGALWKMTTTGAQVPYAIPYDPAGLTADGATTLWFTSQAQGRAPQIVEATFR